MCKITFSIVIILGGILADVFGEDRHPLDPLTPVEIQDTVQVILLTRPGIATGGTWVFNWITLKEPDKDLLIPYFLNDTDAPHNSAEIPRRSFTVLREKGTNTVNEVIVNLHTRSVESWKDTKFGTQAGVSLEEAFLAERIAKDDPQVQERCFQMGWGNMTNVLGEIWSLPLRDKPVLTTALRPIHVYLYGRNFQGDNHFAHPFDFVTTVDLAYDKVIAIDNLPTHSDYNANNRSENVSPKKSANYNPSLIPSSLNNREELSPIHCSQSGGPSYRIRGNEVTWQNFKFRVGYTGREGLVLYHVSYKDGDLRRPLFYRMSLVELVVPYGDPRPPYHQKFPYGMGEFNMGFWAINHREVDICRGGTIHYFDTYLNNEAGEVVPYPGSFCIHEEDAGMLWAKYTRERQLFHTRSQRLTVTWFVNQGNYEYKFSWRFYQDACIEFSNELHGSVSTNLVSKGTTNSGGYGTVVSPQINAQFHQHFFALRLDTEIDGNVNTISTLDVVPVTERSGLELTRRNPFGNGFTVKEQLLRTPREARTLISPLTGRTWFIKNPNKIHSITRNPVAWKLIPYNAPPPFFKNHSPLHPRAAFLDYNVWVTKYKEDQVFPGGFYLNGSGLPEWVREDPNVDITKTDVVLWYMYGVTHLPTVEDWPVMSVENSGFFLRPSNFFLENPALNVAATSSQPPKQDHSCRSRKTVPYFKFK